MRTVYERAKFHAVYPHSDNIGVWIVESGTSGNLYKVGQYTSDGAYFCSCAWGKSHPGGHSCSHIVAVANYVGRKNVVDSLGEPEVVLTHNGENHSVRVEPDGTITVTYFR